MGVIWLTDALKWVRFFLADRERGRKSFPFRQQDQSCS